ncbi:uncharacterized protein LOC129293534 [Prosopis cineraria]|uniref:uncharacterized protein LOC129293534 n=1 Tax=Prosopis cineraria TaxID=364024 RepID=UPI00240F782F|nr:uncharacterized protein LOC129293534 [Prosopis cineraria]
MYSICISLASPSNTHTHTPLKKPFPSFRFSDKRVWLELNSTINRAMKTSRSTKGDSGSLYCGVVLLGLILLGCIRESCGGGGDGIGGDVRGKQLLERPCDEIYVVGEGETLHSIGHKCGDPFIIERNPHIHDPDDVFPGLVIKIVPTNHL